MASAAKDISMGVAVAAVLSELHDIFTFKEEQRVALLFSVDDMFSFYSRLALARVTLICSS